MPTDLKTHIVNFQNWLATDTADALKWQKERTERLDWYGTHLNKDAIGKLSSEEFATFIKDLWATNIWKNKDYKVEQLIKDNGLEKLRLSLDVILRGKDPVEKRWDEFRASIKGLGSSSISEILTFCDPQQWDGIDTCGSPKSKMHLEGDSEKVFPSRDGLSRRHGC